MSKTLKISLATVLLGMVVLAFILLPMREWMVAMVGWVRSLGSLGVAIYALIYIGATVLVLPASVLTLAAGFLYGPLWGTLLISPVSVLSSTLAFLLGRSVAREWIQRRIAQNSRFAAVDNAVAENGFKIVFLLRLSPIFPFALLNYALGLTRVRLRDYVLASFLGMLPGTFLYVYLGSSIASLANLASGKAARQGPWEHVLFWGGLLATLLVVALITRTARKALDQSLPNHSSSSVPPETRS
jgi:uncharacterized membrane protein YdjX (TVP38/TMEM64 family)